MMRRHCVGSSNGDEDNKGSQCTATLAQQSNVRKARMSRTAKRDGKKKEDEDSEGGRYKKDDDDQGTAFLTTKQLHNNQT